MTGLPDPPVHQPLTIAVEAHRVPLTTGVRLLLQEVVQLTKGVRVRAVRPAGAAAAIQLRREAALRAVLLPIPPPAEAALPPVLSEVVAEAVVDVVPAGAVEEVADAPVVAEGSQMN